MIFDNIYYCAAEINDVNLHTFYSSSSSSSDDPSLSSTLPCCSSAALFPPSPPPPPRSMDALFWLPRKPKSTMPPLYACAVMPCRLPATFNVHTYMELNCM